MPRVTKKLDAASFQLKDQVVSINRVTKVVKGGKNMSFAALVVVGDPSAAVVGFGSGKAKEVQMCIRDRAGDLDSEEVLCARREKRDSSGRRGEDRRIAAAVEAEALDAEGNCAQDGAGAGSGRRRPDQHRALKSRAA